MAQFSVRQQEVLTECSESRPGRVSSTGLHVGIHLMAGLTHGMTHDTTHGLLRSGKTKDRENKD